MADAKIFFENGNPKAKRKLIIHEISGEPAKLTLIATDSTTGESVSVTFGKKYFKEEIAALK